MPLTISKTVQRRKKVKTPTKLAVKKNIRHSSVWDKRPTLTDDTFTADKSTSSFRTKENCSLKDSIIVIDSDSDANEDADQFNHHINVLDELYGEEWKKTNTLIFSEPHHNKTLKSKVATPKTNVKQFKRNVGKQSIKKVEETIAPSEKKILHENNLCKEAIQDTKVRLLQTNKNSLASNKVQEKTNKAVRSPWVFRFKGFRYDESSKQKKLNSNFNGNFRKKSNYDNSDVTSSSSGSDNSYSENSDVLFLPSQDEGSDSGSETSFTVNEISKNYKISTKEPQVSIHETFLASLSSHVSLDKCDPSAKLFRTSYKANKTQLAEKLFQLYNENLFNALIPKNTLIEWNKNLRLTGGRCHQITTKFRTGEIQRTVKISLSVKVLDEPHRLRDVLLHEMCHAACFLINKVTDGHGNIFMSWARKAGEVFPELPPVKTCHSYKINTKYSYRCLNCGYCYNRHSKSIDVNKKCCGRCRGKFELLINKSAKGEQKSVPVSVKPPSGFALFVKNNYAVYKTSELKHGEIMKLLGSKFNELKVSLPKE